MNIKWSLLLLITLLLTPFSNGNALVEWDVYKTLKTETTPLDVAVSLDGRRIFVLNDHGEVLIYATDGSFKDKITVGEGIDGIRAGPKENILFLISQGNQTVQVLLLDFIHEIDVSGHPIKGPPDAPVVIAVFSDYQ